MATIRPSLTAVISFVVAETVAVTLLEEVVPNGGVEVQCTRHYGLTSWP
jgi:hypothetical protein